MNFIERIKKGFVIRYLDKYPQVAIGFLQRKYRVSLSSIDLNQLNKVRGFEDLSWLFTSNKSNRGIIRLTFSEAASLFKLVKSFKNPRIFELGRFEGGSTILIASGMDGGKLDSVDINPRNDELLKKVLTSLDVVNNVKLITADANKLNSGDENYDIVFIDGDHSYDAVKKDTDHWKKSVKKSGYLIYHDYGDSAPGVIRVCDSIIAEGEFKKFLLVDSLLILKRV